MSSALRCILSFRNSKPVLQTATLNLSNSGSVLLNLSLQKSYSQLSRTNNGDGKFIRNPLTWCGNNILVRNFSSEDTSLPIPPKPVIGFDTSSPIPPKPEIGFDTSLPIPPKPEIGVDTSWPIPPKPEIEVDIAGEPSFESVGLGGYTPPGLIQQGLEHLHISCDLPWWQCIVIGTCLVRLVVFPVAIYAQKNMANLSNVMPHVMSVQNKMADARKRGNEIEAHQYARELTALLQEKKVNPLKNFLTPAIQMPVFISFFLALRGMVSLPIDSLHSGGALWFVDLTVPDPTYLLPLATSLTLMATIEVGLDTGMNPNQMPVYFKYIFRAMPFLMFPVIINFQGVILVYWLSTNFITLVQTSVLKVTAVRDFFGIPRVVPFKNEFQFPLPGLKPPEKPSFTQGLKESYSNIDKSYEIEERKRIDDLIKQQSLRAKAMESKSASTK